MAKEVTAEAKKKATLLSVCGASTYKLMYDLISPARPRDKTFAELAGVMKKHLKPKPLVIVQ